MPDALNLTGIALSVNQGKWKRLAKSVAQKSLAPLAAQIDQEGSYPRESLKAVADAGLMGLLMPKEYGGPGEGILTFAMVLEELAQGCASTAMVYCMHASTLPIGKWDGMGLRGNCSMPIHFKGCHVPEMARLGSPTCGFSMLFAYSLPIYQVGLATCYLGIAQAAYNAAVEHVKKRVHSDTKMPLSQVETVQRYIAEMKMRVDEARCMVYRVAQMSDNAMVLFNELHSADLLDEIVRENPDDPYFIELAQLKFAVNEIAVEVASKAFQVCGGTAYKRGHPVERHVRDARAGSVMAPSDDSLKLIVGRQILGIPQPWDGDARR